MSAALLNGHDKARVEVHWVWPPTTDRAMSSMPSAAWTLEGQPLGLFGTFCLFCFKMISMQELSHNENNPTSSERGNTTVRWFRKDPQETWGPTTLGAYYPHPPDPATQVSTTHKEHVQEDHTKHGDTCECPKTCQSYEIKRTVPGKYRFYMVKGIPHPLTMWLHFKYQQVCSVVSWTLILLSLWMYKLRRCWILGTHPLTVCASNTTSRCAGYWQLTDTFYTT